MKVICAWCNEKMSELDDKNPNISHGMCKKCLFELTGGGGTNFFKFLDSLEVPIIVFDKDTCVKYTNSKSLKSLEQDNLELLEKLCGDVFMCENATDPKGCGRTDKCSSCELRKTIIETHNSGNPFFNIPVEIQNKNIDRVVTKHFLVTTAKVGDFVILKFISK